jgi:hypothetical protein
VVSLLGLFDFELVIDLRFAGVLLCELADLRFLGGGLNGPRRVTLPSAVMILTFVAVIESESSATTARRIAAVILMSSGLSD